MKKLTKKNNKGFSLVELIVVVLIMAIIAVALAPQVTKWVEKSRIAKDAQNYDTIVSALQIAHAEGKLKKNAVLTGEQDKDWTIDDSDSKVDDALVAELGDNWEKELKMISSESSSTYTITYNHANGTVSRTKAPSTDNARK